MDKEAKDGQRTCLSCRHYEDIGAMFPVHGCWHGEPRSNVTWQKVYRRCEFMRHAAGLCGPDGKLWEPRNG